MINSEFSSREDIIKLARDKGFKKGAEIGVSDGRFSEIMCEIIPDLELLAVDPYLAYKGNMRQGTQAMHDRRYETAKKRLEFYNIVLLRQTSSIASEKVDDESLDFVFIDGNHSFDYTMQDIIVWSRKVRSGGFVIGHDYYNFGNSGVVEAVEAYTKLHNIEYSITSGDKKHNRMDDKVTSFWWVKP